MNTEKKRIFHLDDDELEVLFYYNSDIGKYFGLYPDFIESPHFTPNGRPWVNATNTGCPYSDKVYDDCGSCEYFMTELNKDLIGICKNELNRRKGE